MAFKRKRISRKRTGRRKSLRRAKVPRKFKKYVKREIHRQIENKEINLGVSNQSLTVGQAGGAQPYILHMIPTPSQGTSNSTRIGNNIRPTRCVLKGSVNIRNYDGAVNTNPGPVWIRMLMVKSLAVTYQGGAPAELTTALWKGSGASLGLQAGMLDQCLEVNNDLFRVMYDRRFKIGAGYNTSTGPVASNYYFDNSPMSVNFRIPFRRYLKKLLKFSDEANGNSCQNDNLYLIVLPNHADGSATAGQIPAEIHLCRYFSFEDA